MLHLYNTLTRKKEVLKPLRGMHVHMYSCGPTVYNYVHLGNLRSFIFADTVHRVLKYNGYSVKHVMNITDVGHLTDDADQGEDKMEKGAKREAKTAWEVAAFYTEAFKRNIVDLNILEPHIWCKATDHIQDQIYQVQQLIDKGYTYETPDGIYFDTTKLSDYGKLAGLDKQTLEAGARVDMGYKKHPHDFALWKWSEPGEQHPEQTEQVNVSEEKKPIRQMQWDAPFGKTHLNVTGQNQGMSGKKGFPGWHIECSAMSMKYLGDQFDIHTGGIDHIPVHHTNEIAQAESITEKKPWVQYWLHNEFLLIHNDKMAKSGENFVTLQSVLDKGYEPLAFRYFVLQAHYRKQLNFTWEALNAAATGLKNLREHVQRIPSHSASNPYIRKKFQDALNDDFNTPEALAIVWEGIKSHHVSIEEIILMDKALGLDLHSPEVLVSTLPKEVEHILNQRNLARNSKNWQRSDELRDELLSQGYLVEDTSEGQRIIRKE